MILFIYHKNYNYYPMALKKNLFLMIALLMIFVNTRMLTWADEFKSNAFTDSDVLTWSIAGATLPSSHFFTQCNGNRIAGGYNVFIGDNLFPITISKLFSGIPSHYSITISLKVYKIDSWVNETFFIMIDGITRYTQTWNSSSGSADTCGNPNPYIDSINSNFNDFYINVNITVNHTIPTLNLTFSSNLNSDKGAWGIRELKVSINACQASCYTCSNDNFCQSCDPAVSDLALGIPYCVCTNLKLIQKDQSCTTQPCVACQSPGSCSSNFYQKTSTMSCQKCNPACSGCTGPSNNQCVVCASGYWRNGSNTECLNCFIGCSNCDGTATNCSSCVLGYFYYALQCLTSCPSGYYGLQQLKVCIFCDSSCATCNGASQNHCLTCITSYYLLGSTCQSSCPVPYYTYNWTCVSECPILTYLDSVLLACVDCPSNCQICINSTFCLKCLAGSFLDLSNLCVLICPIGFYGAQTGICLACDSKCQTCSGLTEYHCQSCIPSLVLYKNTCLSSCPLSTYSILCKDCNSLCLQCFGPNSNECITCADPKFLHINQSTCVDSCKEGELSDSLAMTCWECQAGFVGWIQQCVDCSRTCKECYQPFFTACTSCSNSVLKFTTCVQENNTKIIYTSEYLLSSTLAYELGWLFVMAGLGIALFIQLIFTYKSALLPTVQYLQFVAYFYFVSVPLPQSTQKIFLSAYWMHPSSILPPIFRIDPEQYLPVQIKLLSKTGFFLLDSFYPLIFFILIVVLFVMIKQLYFYLQSQNKTVFVLKKLNHHLTPYLLVYSIRILSMEVILAMICYCRNFTLFNFFGAASFTTILLLIFISALSFLWKIRTQNDGKMYAIIYFNEIGQRKPSISQQIYQEQHQNKSYQNSKKMLLVSSIFIIQKLPPCIILIFFYEKPFVQTVSLLIYYSSLTIVHLLIPYRRRIYRFTVLMCNTWLIIISLLLVVIQQTKVNIGFLIDYIILASVLILMLLNVSQIIVNWHYFYSFVKYCYFKIHKCVCGSNKITIEDEAQM